MKLRKNSDKRSQLQALSDGHSQVKEGLISILEIDLEKRKNILKDMLKKARDYQYPSFNEDERKILEGFFAKKIDNYELGTDYVNELESQFKEVSEIILLKNIHGEYVKIQGQEIEDIKKQLLKTLDTMRYLSFENVDLNGLEESETEELFAMLPEDLIGVKIGEDSFSVSELQFLFDLLPKNLKILDLTWMTMTTEFNLDASKLFERLPQSLHTLCIHGLEFGKRNIGEIISMLQSLPRELKKLDLGGFPFKKATVEEIRQIYAALPEGLEVFNLGALHLEDVAKEKVSTVIDNLPKNLLTLDLSAGNLASSCTFNQLHTLFSALGDRLQVLVLNDNDLGTLTDEQFIQLIKLLPQNLRVLDIGSNGLGGFGPSVLLEFVKSLPSGLEVLDLLSSGLNDIRFDDLKNIFSYLPTSLKEIRLLHNDFGYCKREMLGLTGDYEVKGVGSLLEDLTD